MKRSEDKVMVRYLLGELPEKEQVALEELCFTDNDTFERMWASENELVDDYVRDRLQGPERDRFESHYLASPVHQRRVQAAKFLLGAAATPELPQPSLAERLKQWLGGFRLPELALTGALVALAAGGIWLFLERSRLRDEVDNLRIENAVHKQREAQLESANEAQRSEINRLTETPGRQRDPLPEPPKASRIFAFVLSPISVRSGAGQSFVVPHDAQTVQLRLKAPSGEWTSYRAEIRSVGQRTAWSSGRLIGRGGNISVEVPAGRLSFDDYILTLSGVTGDGRTEEIERYSFRVMRN